MANMNEEEIQRINGFFQDDSMEQSGTRHEVHLHRERSRYSRLYDSPNELSMNLTITSRDSHRRVERPDRTRDEPREPIDKHHIRLQRGAPRTPLEIAASELEKFNSWVHNFEKKGSDIVAALDRAEKYRCNREENLLRSQAYNDIQLLGLEVKKHHRDHVTPKEVCGPTSRQNQVQLDKLRLEVELLRNSNRQKEAEIERHTNIIKQMQDEMGEKENSLAVMEERLGDQQHAITVTAEKLLKSEVESAMEVTAILVERNIEVGGLNYEIKHLTDKLTQLVKEVELANFQKSTLMSQTKNLQHKLSQLTESSNHRPASGSKNMSMMGEFTMRHLSFSIDPTQNDIHEWINIFDQYHKHYAGKYSQEEAEFAKKGKRMSKKDKQASENAHCRHYFQQILNTLKAMQTVRESLSKHRPEQKSPMKQLHLNRNSNNTSHNTSTQVFGGENRQRRKQAAIQAELQFCQRSLQSKSKQLASMQQENVNICQIVKELKKQLLQLNDFKEKCVCSSGDFNRAGELEQKIRELEAQQKEYKTQLRKMSVLLKNNKKLTIEMAQLTTKNNHLELKIGELTMRCNELELKAKELQYHLQSESILRRKLHNQLEDMKGNIRVYCRIRPLIQPEVDRRCQVMVSNERDEVKTMIDRQQKFQYDAVFGPDSSQQDVFEETKKMVQSAFDGYNVCIFAYGQTGSGKTYTMHGTESSPGLAHRCIDQLYSLIGRNQKVCNISVEMQMVEIYLDNVYDLFDKSRKPLQLQQDKESKEVIVKDGYRFKMKQAEDMHSAYKEGLSNRKMSMTHMNSESSRSHLLFMVRVEVEFKEGKDRKKRRGILNIVDLAGSEKASKAGLKDSQIKESIAINNSLTSLGRVLTALNNKDAHIPYRGNKLTYLLKDSLGGNSKTLMFVNVSPADYNINESIASLNFAKNVKNIQRGQAQINMVRQRINSQQDEKVVRRPIPRHERSRTPQQ